MGYFWGLPKFQIFFEVLEIPDTVNLVLVRTLE